MNETAKFRPMKPPENCGDGRSFRTCQKSARSARTGPAPVPPPARARCSPRDRWSVATTADDASPAPSRAASAAQAFARQVGTRTVHPAPAAATGRPGWGAALIHSNLGGLGPIGGAGETGGTIDPTLPPTLRLGPIGTDPATGRSLDVVISNSTAYRPWKTSKNGLTSSGLMGQINLETPHEGEGIPGVDYNELGL
eukprot:6426749-Prymnesium_polylepis.1